MRNEGTQLPFTQEEIAIVPQIASTQEENSSLPNDRNEGTQLPSTQVETAIVTEEERASLPPPTCLHCGQAVSLDPDDSNCAHSFSFKDLPYAERAIEKPQAWILLDILIDNTPLVICRACPDAASNSGAQAEYRPADRTAYTRLIMALTAALEMFYDYMDIPTIFRDILSMLQTYPRGELAIFYKTVTSYGLKMPDKEVLEAFLRNHTLWDTQNEGIETLPLLNPSGVELLRVEKRPFPGLDPQIHFSQQQFRAMLASHNHPEMMDAYRDMANTPDAFDSLLQYQRDHNFPCKNFLTCRKQCRGEFLDYCSRDCKNQLLGLINNPEPARSAPRSN